MTHVLGYCHDRIKKTSISCLNKTFLFCMLRRVLHCWNLELEEEKKADLFAPRRAENHSVFFCFFAVDKQFGKVLETLLIWKNTRFTVALSNKWKKTKKITHSLTYLTISFIFFVHVPLYCVQLAHLVIFRRKFFFSYSRFNCIYGQTINVRSANVFSFIFIAFTFTQEIYSPVHYETLFNGLKQKYCILKILFSDLPNNTILRNKRNKAHALNFLHFIFSKFISKSILWILYTIYSPCTCHGY